MSDSKPPIDWMEILKPPALPSQNDSLFTSQEDWWNNACVNWCHDGWGLYADGYKEAADLLVKHVEASGASQDTLVYPVLFLYRQHLELEIKDLIRQARRLQNISAAFPSHHRIDDLWTICYQLLTEIFPNESGEELVEIGRLISEFAAVDPASMAFRYPEDKKGNPSLSGMSRINLRNVREVIEKIHVIFLGAGAMLGEYLSFKSDMEWEYRNEP